MSSYEPIKKSYELVIKSSDYFRWSSEPMIFMLTNQLIKRTDYI